ncbi:hypothetical protein BSZ36_05070 [Rubricoccus marinus]|uniref:Uncharacterized protein n=1 Tax=Rubricoccus marinus TaxID=716817 RepID=A0A259TXH7_9BACT|nr:hypothetical protein BSZ36_05070 [Rubricoccus marinus]
MVERGRSSATTEARGQRVGRQRNGLYRRGGHTCWCVYRTAVAPCIPTAPLLEVVLPRVDKPPPDGQAPEGDPGEYMPDDLSTAGQPRTPLHTIAATVEVAVPATEDTPRS